MTTLFKKGQKFEYTNKKGVTKTFVIRESKKVMPEYNVVHLMVSYTYNPERDDCEPDKVYSRHFTRDKINFC